MSLQEERHDGDGGSSPVTPKLCPACGTRYPLDALFCPTDGTPLQIGANASGPDVDPYVGKEILGHMEIRQLAGIGAMGRVYRAFQKGIDRDVAVKILHRELSANQQLVARFHREAKVASRLQHANVVHAYLTGQLPDGSMYIVMEYLDGLSLQSALAAVGGAMPLARALHIALQLCDATGEAHAQGIVHRDIKPENVMLLRRGDDEDFVKVLDFGIARLNWGDQSMATAAGLIFGTARYISPEGAQGEQVGPQSDVYSIATLVYQMLAGRTPFEGESAVALLVQQIHDPPPPLKSIPRAAYVPQPIADLLMRNLAKSPAGRAKDGRELGRALVDAAKASGLSPEDLLARGSLLGGRPSAPMQIAPLQRTRQMMLDAETQERLSGAQPRTSYQPPAGSSAPPARGPLLGTATTKWTPPPSFHAELSQPAFPPPRRSSVDATLDDGVGATPPLPPASLTPSAPVPVPAPARAAPVSVKPASGVDSTLGDHDEAEPSGTRAAAVARGVPGASGGRGRIIAVVLVCFLVGVLGAAAICFKMGLLGGPSRASLESDVSRATDAMMHQRWDAPAGNNVLDITNEGLTAYPNDPQLLRVRAVSCDEVVKIAERQHKDGDLPESLRMMKLAHELDPSDDSANRHLIEYQADMDRVQKIAPAGDGSATPGKLSATLDAAPSTPRAGQAAELVVHIALQGATKPKVEGAAVSIAGNGVYGVQIPTTVDASGVALASYTFRRAGRYTVTFGARVNGAQVSAVRTVDVIASGAPLPLSSASASAVAPGAAPAPGASLTAPVVPPPTSPASAEAPGAQTPAPSATGTGKWL